MGVGVVAGVGLALAAVGTATQIYGGIKSAQAQKEAGENNAKYYNALADQTDRQVGFYDQEAGFLDKQAAAQTAAGEFNVSSIQDEGARNAALVARKGKETSGAQTAAMAASGVPLGSVTAQDVAGDSFDRQKLDEMVVRYTADMKSSEARDQSNMAVWNTKMQKRATNIQALNAMDQANNYRLAGKYGVQAANMNATSTLLGTAGSVANTWAGYAISRGK